MHPLEGKQIRLVDSMSAYWVIHLCPHYNGHEKFKTQEEAFSYCAEWRKNHPHERQYPHGEGFWSGNFRLVGGTEEQEIPQFLQLMMDNIIRCQACTGSLYMSGACWADISEEGYECKTNIPPHQDTQC
jgi:hypothetical protein